MAELSLWNGTCQFSWQISGLGNNFNQTYYNGAGVSTALVPSGTAYPPSTSIDYRSAPSSRGTTDTPLWTSSYYVSYQRNIEVYAYAVDKYNRCYPAGAGIVTIYPEETSYPYRIIPYLNGVSQYTERGYYYDGSSSASSISRGTILSIASNYWSSMFGNNYSIMSYSSWISYDPYYDEYQDLRSSQTNYFNVNFTQATTRRYTVSIYTASGGGGYSLDDSYTSETESSYVYVYNTYSGYSSYEFEYAYSGGSSYGLYDSIPLSTSYTTQISIYLRYPLYYYRCIVSINGSSTQYSTVSSTSSTAYVYDLMSSYAQSDYVLDYATSSASQWETYDLYDYIGLTSSKNDSSNPVVITLYCKYSVYPYSVYIYLGDTEEEAIQTEDYYYYSDSSNQYQSRIISSLVGYSEFSSNVFIRAEYNGSYYTDPSHSISFTSSTSNVVKLRFRRQSAQIQEMIYIDGSYVESYGPYMYLYSTLPVTNLFGYQKYGDDYHFDYAYTANTYYYLGGSPIPINLSSGSTKTIYVYLSTKRPYTILYKYSDVSTWYTLSSDASNVSQTLDISAHIGYNIPSGNEINYDISSITLNDTTVPLTNLTVILDDGANIIRIYMQRRSFSYNQYVFIDGSYSGDSSGSMVSTTQGIVVSTLSKYSEYMTSGLYMFSHATKNDDGSYQYAATDEISLSHTASTAIQLYFTSLAVKPSVSISERSPGTITLRWEKNGATNGDWYILYGTDSSMSQYTTVPVSATGSGGTYAVTGLEQGVTYYFACRHVFGSASATSDIVSSAPSIQLFSWTNDDASKIRSGQPISNLTAGAWNNLIDSMNAVRVAHGSDKLTIPYVYTGQTISKNTFNTLRNAIAGLVGAGSVVILGDGVQKVMAIYFANSTTYDDLKAAVNRAISAANNQ